MQSPSASWGKVVLSAVAVIAVIAAAIGALSSSSADATKAPDGSPPSRVGDAATARADVLTVARAPSGRAIQAGFLGLSLEYSSIPPYAGRNPLAVNPVFEQLIRNLTPHQKPMLRIGGDTTDWTWYPVPHMARPAGVRITLDKSWLGVMAAMSKTLDARLILGINLEANNPRLSAAEARALLSGIGRDRIAALEIGNEPELYGSLAWFVLHGKKVYGRPHSYSYTDYLHDIARMRAALPRFPLAGPAVGGPLWRPKTGRFVAAESRRLAIVTLHRYPLQKCFKSPSSPLYPSVAHLLSSRATRGLAEGVAPYVALAHAHGLPLRIDEINSISCGVEHHVSDTFVSALWAVDALFEMARVGVDGVNVYSNPGTSPQLFTFREVRGQWSAFVEPDYYGLLMFAQAAPPGSRLLLVSGASGSIKAWATRAPDGRIRIVVINQGTTGSRALSLRVPGATGTARLERLRAPSLEAHHGVTLGGQGFGSTTSSGLLAGRSDISSVRPHARGYDVRLPPASALMLTMAAR